MKQTTSNERCNCTAMPTRRRRQCHQWLSWTSESSVSASQRHHHHRHHLLRTDQLKIYSNGEKNYRNNGSSQEDMDNECACGTSEGRQHHHHSLSRFSSKDQHQQMKAIETTNNNNKANRSNKLIIKIIFMLLITTITIASISSPLWIPTTTSVIVTQITALRSFLLKSTTLVTMMRTSPSSSKAAATTFIIFATTMATGTKAAALSQQQQQQRQFQQQQLFAMLTKNGQQSASGSTGGFGGGGALVGSGVAGIAATDDDDDGFGRDNILRRNAVDIRSHNDDSAVSLETIGFVSDDGDQRYEKAEKVLAAAAAAAAAASASGNRSQNQMPIIGNGNCPKECKCLNDFFDCAKKHLDRVPALPGYVQILDLGSNKLNDTTVLQIKNLTELKRLSLKRNQLDTVPKFTGLPMLRQLNLANNRIQRISSEALAALPKLRNLDLSRNFLHTLEANYFPSTNRLVQLVLNANEIANIEEQSFEHLTGLVDLELNSNRLTALPAGVFKNLNKLRKLSLNNNHVEINWSTFKGLQSLQKLYLQSNGIRVLQDGVFHIMRGIEIIELDHNDITSLSRQGLFNLTKLQHLSLSNNSISRIELDTWEFTQSLVTLDLSFNNITEFKPQHLDCLQQLRELNLGHNKIQFFADNTFDCVKNLEDLNLKRNRLAWVIEDPGAAPPFKALRKLKNLDLSGNNLKQINSKSLSGLSSLEQLNLDGNALASIQSGAFDHMSHLQKLKFKSMNFICDCELLWFRRWLQARTSQGSGQMRKNAICGYPDQLLDRELLSLTPGDLVCADSPKPVIIQEPSNQLAVKGANITMECIANSPAAASLAAADELKIKWRHDNQNLRERGSSSAGGGGGVGGVNIPNGISTSTGPTQLHNFHPNPHHHHHNHHHHHGPGSGSNSYSTTDTQVHHDQSTNQTRIIGYLNLYNVSYESAGRYQCVVSNAFGTTYSQKFKFSIGIHPTFLQVPSNLTIDSGDTARLVCSAKGDPMPEIALQKFGATAFPAATERRLQVIREENAFVITNAKPIDTGIYTCTAESAAGEIKVNATLVVNDKPQPTIPVVNKESVLGTSSVLECLSEFSADLQHPHREWFKDNKPFHTSPTSASERYYFTTEKELLVIMKTQAMDAGDYRCEITDDSKTHSLQTKLIVVQEDLSRNIILMAAFSILTCILIVSLIACACLYCQRRKLYSSTGQNGSLRVIGSGHSQRTLNGSRGSILEQTQLTTLNRTFLRPKQNEQVALRPRSLADMEMNGGLNLSDPEQHNCLIISSSKSYQQQQQSEQQQRQPHPSRHYDGAIDAYLRRNSLYDVDHHQQDHLSSKDSGTGSDAAVKRSIDDFTIALLPVSMSVDAAITLVPTHQHNGPVFMLNRQKCQMHDEMISHSDTERDNNDHHEDNDDTAATPTAADSDPDIATSPVVGYSAPRYADAMEMQEFHRSGGNPNSSATPSPSTSGGSERYPNNHSSNTPTLRKMSSNNFEGGGSLGGAGGKPLIIANTKCKQDLSTSFSANAASLPTTQVVDI